MSEPTIVDTDVMASQPVPISITRAEIDLGRLRSNTKVMQRVASPASLMAIIKADAYGHGAVECARTLAHAGVDFFAVATLAEAAALRKSGIAQRILVLAAPLREQLPYYEQLGLEITVPSVDVLTSVIELFREGRALPCHVKIDTGMGRIGISPDRFETAAGLIRQSQMPIASFWTHFAKADDPLDPLTGTQRDMFFSLVGQSGVTASEVHVMNTGSLIAGTGATPAGDRVRVGISLYGVPGFTSSIQHELEPVMTFRSKILQVKNVPAGTGISYGHRWVTTAPTQIATVGAGYADGFPRVISDTAQVGIQGNLHRIAGTVCMDMFMVDVGLSAQIRVGEDVTLFGDGGPSAARVAKWANTIPYELFCRVGKRVPRIYSDSAPA